MAQAVRDYEKLALDVIELTGGKDNISSAARCATRLRLVLKETPADAHEKVAALPGVITVVEKGGQFQVVIGPHVGDVFAIVAKELNLDEKTTELEEPEEKQSLINRLIQMMSGVFAPICYVLAAAGLIQGVLIIISKFSPGAADTGAYQIFDLISWAPFTFLPVLIALTASKHFRCNTYVAIACVLALVSPTYSEIAQQAADGETIRFFFVKLTETTYTSTVLPPLILVGLLAVFERFLDKRLPDVIKPLLTPVICLAVLVPLIIIVIGPVVQLLSNGVAAGYNRIYAIAPPIAAAIVGGFWEVIVIFGIHWGMVPIVIANFAQNGCDSIQVFITIAVVSQMAGAFGVFLKTKDRDLKGMALSSGITAIFGITEPTIYGITLPKKKPFVFACICAGLGSIAASLFGSMNYVYAGLPGLISTVNSISDSNPNSFVGCMVGCAIAIVGTIALIMIYGYESKESKNEPSEAATQETAAPAETGVIYSPLNGELKPLSEVDDPTFSEGILGQGAAVLPSEGKVYAPFDGTVMSLFDTKHAIGLTDGGGAEILIHVGLETVTLGGKYFEAKVKVNDHVKKGDLLLTFNLEEIKKQFDTITPVIVSNMDVFSGIKTTRDFGPVKAGDEILRLEK